ncbi:MAG: DNA translocase FtsK [Candidatus Marinimicrobia bacterium]|jgi:S-DNA-T family DNA segregation ATPase FtsK/SpoIIIE|nr:DNA translocase FtsK [Candidatus Neomarinimicrobiota bacterium]MBT3617604.1 DNA translocase FtsK [Candidatus Neomarinimicrobiota bacterium]MBT3829811.1 DNA translocase FtsK [Candidatus Neomarinimicrobiota bacterium]MBT3996807.1 DNA translocase FtsK [Candidatus Neomarinimicrobiota bacterium]MBT4280074.1 DNA translocase FtsK [Candidatus Neomarinimicrobiota bacterium]
MNEKRLEILGILAMAVSFLVFVSQLGYHPGEDPGGISANTQIENPMGAVGVLLAWVFIKMTFGYSTLVLPALGSVWGWWLFSKKDLGKLIKMTQFFLASMVLTAITIGSIEKTISENSSFAFSGVLAGTIAHFLHEFFLHPIGAFTIILVLWLILVRSYFSFSFYAPIEKWINIIKTKRAEKNLVQIHEEEETEKKQHTQNLLSKLKQKTQGGSSKGVNKEKVDPLIDAKNEDASSSEAEEPKDDSIEANVDEKEDPIASNAEVSDKLETPQLDDMVESETGDENAESQSESGIEIGEEVKEEEIDLDSIAERTKPKRKYQLPPADILETPPTIQSGLTKVELVDRANFLTQSLNTFGVEGRVVNVSPGPVITLFEVEPAEGVRVNKFVALADDLARVMEASRVRIIAPIPGKSSVGIEIPNKDPDTVYFKSVISSEKFVNTKFKLTLAIGKTTSGEISTLELEQMPHLLIAGTTGSGKSVCLNTIVCSLLYSAAPDEIKFVIIDPKKVEMTLYRGLEGYHLLEMDDIDEPIVTSHDHSILALRSVEKEMERRYNKMADETVRNISEYNSKMKNNGNPIMPYIIVVIDELADLMMMSARDVEAPIARLAQLSRAVGIHLIIATQRPSVDVITGVIKANFPSRIAFQVATKIDSRTIIDMQGAEKLIGKGDMLFLGSGSSDPVRLHNAFISLNEIEAIVSHVKGQPKPEALVLPSVREGIVGTGGFDGGGELDEMFNEAVKLVVTHQQGSISLLQRRLKLGYSRAARIIDEMEQAGIVGPFTGSKAREVLVDETYIESLNP